MGVSIGLAKRHGPDTDYVEVNVAIEMQSSYPRNSYASRESSRMSDRVSTRSSFSLSAPTHASKTANNNSPPHASKTANNKTGNMTVKVITGVRDTFDSKYGISFCRKTAESPIIIKEVRKDGIFARQGLVPGMVVKAVNGEKVQWRRPTEAATLLAQTDIGKEVSVAVESFTGRVHRTKKSQKWGVTLKNSTKMSGIFIAGIESDALFASTELKPGMKVIRINGKRCPREAKDVISMVARTGDDLEIVGVYTNPKAEAEKENEGEKKEVTDETALNRMFPTLALL